MTAVNEEHASELEAKLREKEQLVGVLTQRLEQAAEQLDRVRRNGGDRRSGGGSMPVEFIEQQAKTLEELQLAVERFEAADSAEKLARIEMRVTEIRDMLVSGGATVSANGSATDDGRSPDQDSKAAWEAMKAQLMGDGDEEPPASNAVEPSAAGNGQADESADSSVTPPPTMQAVLDVDPVDPPEEIDVEAVDAEALKQAVLDRDEYIAHLLARLRVEQTRTHHPVDWEALADCPDDLRERLEVQESKLEDALRRAEVELSLERARLSRVESELEHRGERLEKELVKLGIDDESLDKAADESAEKGPRWMRILGLNDDKK